MPVTQEEAPIREAPHGNPSAAGAPPPLVGLSLLLVFVIGFGAIASFYLLLSVVPLYATVAGAGGIGAGFATGALMCSTVAAELATPYMMGKFGYRTVLTAGVVLIGLPSLALIPSSSIAAILAICLVRGIGLGITVVVGSSLVVSFVPAERHAEALGLYGVVVGIPAVVGLPLGVWLAIHFGFTPVFVGGAAIATATLPAVLRLPPREPDLTEPIGFLSALRTPELNLPALIFAGTAMAAGVVVTFLPLMVTQAAGNVAAAGLLVQAVSMTLMRGWAGRYGAGRNRALLAGSVLMTAAGILAVAASNNAVVILVSMAVFGGGFGIAQNTSLALMFERVSKSRYDAVSALWNAAYDTGLGVGGAGFGLLAARSGYRVALVVVAIFMIAALVPMRRLSALSIG
jgi:predicted MFS family arabinose efflux permease